MNCYFCHKPCQSSATHPNSVEHKCFYHPMAIIHNVSDLAETVYFTVKYKSKEYDIYFHLKSKQCKMYKNIDLKPFIHFRYIPEITPENFLRKLPTLLTFS